MAVFVVGKILNVLKKKKTKKYLHLNFKHFIFAASFFRTTR